MSACLATAVEAHPRRAGLRSAAAGVAAAAAPRLGPTKLRRGEIGSRAGVQWQSWEDFAH